MRSNYIEMHSQEILFLHYNVLQFFCVPLKTDCLSDLHKKFQVASIYDTNVKYQIQRFIYLYIYIYILNPKKIIGHQLFSNISCATKKCFYVSLSLINESVCFIKLQGLFN